MRGGPANSRTSFGTAVRGAIKLARRRGDLDRLAHRSGVRLCRLDDLGAGARPTRSEARAIAEGLTALAAQAGRDHRGIVFDWKASGPLERAAARIARFITTGHRAAAADLIRPPIRFTGSDLTSDAKALYRGQ
jgi:hypothetical protein